MNTGLRFKQSSDSKVTRLTGSRPIEAYLTEHDVLLHLTEVGTGNAIRGFLWKSEAIDLAVAILRHYDWPISEQGSE